jgi:hypothetical protein
MQMKNLMRITKIIFILLLCSLPVANCNFAPFLSDSAYDTVAVASGKATIIARMTLTAEPALDETANSLEVKNTATAEVQCAYVWAVNPEAELTSQFQAVIPQSMQSMIQMGVAWYGENCVNIQTNQIVQFSAMDMEITVSYAKQPVQTATWMGEQIEQVMTLLIPELEKNPQWARYPKNIHFIFNQVGDTSMVNFDLDKYLNLKEKIGLSGEALVQALRK